MSRARSLTAIARLTALAVLLATAFAVGAPQRARAHGVVIFDEAGPQAPHVGLIGDSTLAGVRWADSYGMLRRYNFVLDAESCRRTIGRSCWSREQYRPSTALSALQERAGSWGQVLVVMTGYNDAPDDFPEGVDAVVAEARRQGITTVVWLTLRAADDVGYEDPLGEANAATYRDANRMLHETAARSGGYLQVADWATYAADHGDWFGPDGVHLSDEGVEALTTFLADRLAVVLAGGNLNPGGVPWIAVESGDRGAEVSAVQEALQRAGIGSVGPADGVFGPVTELAVREFQQRRQLAVTGQVDEATAVALGLHRPAGARSATTATATGWSPSLWPTWWTLLTRH